MEGVQSKEEASNLFTILMVITLCRPQTESRDKSSLPNKDKMLQHYSQCTLTLPQQAITETKPHFYKNHSLIIAADEYNNNDYQKIP